MLNEKVLLVVMSPFTTVSPEPLMFQARPLASMSLTFAAGKIRGFPAGRLFVRPTLLAEARTARGWVNVNAWSPTKATPVLLAICGTLATTRSPPRAKTLAEPMTSAPAPSAASAPTPRAPPPTVTLPVKVLRGLSRIQTAAPSTCTAKAPPLSARTLVMALPATFEPRRKRVLTPPTRSLARFVNTRGPAPLAWISVLPVEVLRRTLRSVTSPWPA